MYSRIECVSPISLNNIEINFNIFTFPKNDIFRGGYKLVLQVSI